MSMADPGVEQDYVARIRAYVAENFLFEADPAAVPTDQSLVDGGIVDSYGIVELAMWLEREFDISIQDDEIVREHFGSIAEMARFVAQKRQTAARATDHDSSNRD